MLKLKLQYFGHLIWRADSFVKTLMLGKIEGRGRRVRQRMRWLDGITVKSISPSRHSILPTCPSRTDAEAEAPILWPHDAKGWLIWKDPTAGKDWRREDKRTTEDEMIGWHHRLNGHELQQTPGVGDGQRRLACCSPWNCRVGHDWVTEMNWTCCWVGWVLILYSDVYYTTEKTTMIF